MAALVHSLFDALLKNPLILTILAGIFGIFGLILLLRH
jgi:hypothetical protein